MKRLSKSWTAPSFLFNPITKILCIKILASGNFQLQIITSQLYSFHQN